MVSKTLASLDAWLAEAEEVLAEQRNHPVSETSLHWNRTLSQFSSRSSRANCDGQEDHQGVHVRAVPERGTRCITSRRTEVRENRIGTGR